ncbi:MAG: hypothetical protein GY725_01465 [bacterium]|nr:hypothetical protein [bacterium]
MSRIRFCLFLLLLIIVPLAPGCSQQPELSETALRPVGELRFAGVDLIYALRRVAANADLPLVLDEIRPKDGSPDLLLYRIDIDLPAGPLQTALEILQEETQDAFSFEIRDRVLYVRSRILIGTETVLDEKFIRPPFEFEGTLEDLLTRIMNKRPWTFLRILKGKAPMKQAKFTVQDETTSSLELMLRHAEHSGQGWHMPRAGYVKEKTEKNTTFVGSSVMPWSSLTSTNRIPDRVGPGITLNALANLRKRTATSMLVLDRSVWQDLRGGLNYSSRKDPGERFELEAALDMVKRIQPTREAFSWEIDEGLVRIEGSHYTGKLRGRDFMRSELKGGTFEGSLPELSRWINENHKSDTRHVLMSGEIRGGEKIGKIEIKDGSSAKDVLGQFARATNTGVYIALLELIDPVTGKAIVRDHLWNGAYVADLDDWTTEKLNSRFETASK